jgi:hypothetical protein
MASTFGIESTGTQSPEYYTWAAPGKPVRFELSLNLVDSLLREVMRGFGAIPRKGVEAGGILIGSVSERNPLAVRIEAFEPIPCQHRHGPTYTLTPDELRAMKQAVVRCDPSRDRRSYAVGYYRSHLRPGLALSETDLAMYDAFFPDPSNVVLLIKPFATRASVGAFFFREAGEVHGETSYREFPFRRADLAGAQPDLPPDDPPPAPPEPEAPADPPPAPAASSNRGKPLLFAVAGLLAGLLAAVGVAYRFPAALDLVKSGPPYALNLQAGIEGNLLQIRWDRNSPAILNAESAVLTIDDGAQRRILELSPGTLRQGRMTYDHQSPEVRIWLEIVAGERHSVSESLDFRAPRP